MPEFLAKPVRFRFYDGTVVEFPTDPQCRARTSRGNRRCRNEVLKSQPGPWFYDTGPVAGMEVMDERAEPLLREQLCPTHYGREGVTMFVDYEGREINSPTL